MKKLVSILIAVLMVLTVFPAFAADNTSPAGSAEYVEGEAIVIAKPTAASVSSIDSSIQIKSTLDFTPSGGTLSGTESDPGFMVYVVSSDKYSTNDIVEKYSAMSGVLCAAPNYIRHAAALTDDTYSDWQWALKNDGQFGSTNGSSTNADSVWSSGTTGSDAVVAVIDTGVDYTHEDLADNMWINPYPRSLLGKYGYDFCDGDNDPMDENGHGSHCAGIIGAVGNNSVGISGINQDVSIMALRFLDSDGSGNDSNAISCFNYIYKAMQLGANVKAINCSFGSPGDVSAYDYVIDAVGKLGAITCIAAGNSSEELGLSPDRPTDTESKYRIVVSAASPEGELASFSCYSPYYSDIAAPGANILSTVSYENFMPELYSDREAAMQAYNDYSEPGFGFDDCEIVTDLPDGSVTLGTDSSQNFGSSSGTALKIDVSGALKGNYVYLLFPYDASAGEGSVYTSLRMTYPNLSAQTFVSFAEAAYTTDPDELSALPTMYEKYQSAGSANYWRTLNGTADEYSGDQKRALVVKLEFSENTDCTMLFDDPAVSVPGIEDLPKYDFYNGTSMATPYVAGAVALASAVYPDLSTSELKNRIISSATQTGSLSGKVVSGGYLDLSKLGTVKPYIDTAEVTSKDTVLLTGTGFGSVKGSVTADGKNAGILSWSDTGISISAQNLINQNAVINVSNSAGSCARRFYLVKGKEEYQKELDLSELSDYASMVTDGTNLYMLIGAVLLAEYTDGDLELISSADEEALSALFPHAVGDVSDAATYLTSNPVYLNGSIYMAACLDQGYACEYSLIRYKFSTDEWLYVSDLPDFGGMENAIYSTLAVFNGRLYLMGGMDAGTFDTVRSAMRFNGSSRTWERISDMPEGRFMANAQQIGSKLYLMLGGNDDDTSPKTLIFDGRSWSTGAALPSPTAPWTCYIPNGQEYDEETDEYYTTYDEKPYYNAAIGASDGGIVIGGLATAQHGDTFFYNVSTDSYSAMDAQLYAGKYGALSFGTVVGDTLYAISRPSASETGGTLYSTTIEPGLLDLTVEYDGSGSGTVYGEDSYLPGDIAYIKAVADKGSYLAELTLDGRALKNPSSVVMSSEHTVYARFEKYATKVSLSLHRGYIESGKTRTLTTKLSGSSAGVTWKSSNTAYATVSQLGVVTAKAAGLGKTVRITATAKDGSGAADSCLLYIFRKTTSLSLSPTAAKLQAGHSMTLSAKRTPALYTIPTLAWSSSNTKYAAVNAQGVITAKAAGKGKTVTITAKAIDGTGKKASCRVTIV